MQRQIPFAASVKRDEQTKAIIIGKEAAAEQRPGFPDRMQVAVIIDEGPYHPAAHAGLKVTETPRLGTALDEMAGGEGPKHRDGISLAIDARQR